MSGEARKLHLIEAILKLEDESLLNEVESVLNNGQIMMKDRKRPEDFAGIWSAEEADEIKKLIEDSCEQIDPDDWK